MKRDSNGKELKDGDTIKTDKGVLLEIVVKDGEYFVKNTSNGQVSSLDILSIDFYKI